MSKEAVETSLDLEFVDRCVSQIGTSQAQTLAHLQALQKEYGYLPPQALERLSEITGRPLEPSSRCSFNTEKTKFTNTTITGGVFWTSLN